MSASHCSQFVFVRQRPNEDAIPNNAQIGQQKDGSVDSGQVCDLRIDLLAVTVGVWRALGFSIAFLLQDAKRLPPAAVPHFKVLRLHAVSRMRILAKYEKCAPVPVPQNVRRDAE
jgi:hypothetical protein